MSNFFVKAFPHRAPTFAITLTLLVIPASLGFSQDEADDPLADSVATTEESTGHDSGNPDEPKNWEQKIDDAAGKYLVSPLAQALFFDFGTKHWLGTSIPFVVVWLMLGAVFLTIRMGFINVRAFWHAIRVTKGDYDDPKDTGEVTHFQALTSALSATVGLGNIAGVAIAVGQGGPGAIFWMILAGFFGMTSKFVECSLAQMYRKVDRDGVVSGGPMRYLHDGLREMGIGPVGAVLAVLFAILCVGGSVGGGCAFQVVQAKGVLVDQLPILEDNGWIFGLIMVVMVGIVIIGGIRRIAAAAEKIVPAMCAMYVLVALVILAINFRELPWAFGEIFRQAFTWKSAFGGMLGVMVIGIKRAAFSNEAGVGSAAIAHSAAKTEQPVREGTVALLGPFIDTVVICTMTGLVIVVTRAYDTDLFTDHKAIIDANKGALLTSKAFASVVSWFPILLAIAATLFAYSTMISWSYYGERCFTFLFGARSSMVYRLGFLVFVFLGSIVSATNILEFSDLMILSMAFPNILGLLLLSGKVKSAMDVYFGKLKSGEFKTRQELEAK